MSRPADWWVLDLDDDPTPGDPTRVRELGRSFSGLATDAYDAAVEVRRLAGSDGVAGWVGEAGAKFAEAVGELPGQLDKLDGSYSGVGRALATFAGALETAQEQADAALARGREARARLETAQGQVASAEGEVAATSTALSGTDTLTGVPGLGAPTPGLDPTSSSTALRAYTTATDHLAYVNALVGDAQQDVDAERKLALAAKGVREEAAAVCKGDIDRASDAGIHNRGFLGRAGDLLGDVWHGAVSLAKVVVVVAGVAAMVVGGPLAWVAFAAALVVFADTLSRYADGDASLFDVGLALLECIPGTKGFTTAAGLLRGVRNAGAVLRAGAAGLVRGGATLGRTALRRVHACLAEWPTTSAPATNFSRPPTTSSRPTDSPPRPPETST